MSKEYVCGLTARKKLGCDKDVFLQLVELGEIQAERTETGSWSVSQSSIDAYLAKHDIISSLENENRLLKEQLEFYKNILREIKRTLPEEL